MSNKLYIRTHWVRMPSMHPRGYTDWAVAEIMIDGDPLIARASDHEGVNKDEETTMRTAVALVKNDLNRWLNDIREASNQSHPEVLKTYGLPQGGMNGSVPAKKSSANV